ncbi:MAG: hypothetical protein NMK33_01195 [Candidatus Cardinium sp.]|uniref:hypothetical protein n=1 Tax=Cardinium endosymbiont of Dermatophagoides farinae TaxID=2597823 RepID=UPI001642A39F|nr:hypothetical protein [Cardinium endosymbiont of Dermatophagoides farinae]UWW97169.1 MAG: hypothetical protein NMK33_01195 [Candidatus Cardinium sp.]
MLQKNIIASTKLKEKAVKLREKASTLTKASRVSIAAEQDRLAWKSKRKRKKKKSK